MELVGVLSFVFVLADVAATSSDNRFTCEAGNFSLGEPAALTCHFGPNIHNEGYHFEIMQYAFDALDSDTGDTVLQCHWVGKAHQCKTKSGFSFDGKVQENVTLTIPQVKLEFAGRYACQLIPPDERTPRLCDLHVDESSLRTGLAEDVCYSPTGTTVAFIFGVLLIVCIIVIVYLLCRIHKTKSKRALRCFKRIRRRGKAYTDTKGMQLDDDEVRGPFIMEPIRPYTDSDLVDELEEEIQNKKFNGDDEDASREPFIIYILPLDETEETQQEDNTEQTKKLQPPRPSRPFREAYQRDAYTASVEPSKASVSENVREKFSMPPILPFEKLDDRDKTDQAPPQNVKMTETGLRRTQKTNSNAVQNKGPSKNTIDGGIIY